MKTKRIRHVAIMLALAMMLLISSGVMAQAKDAPPRNGRYEDAAGNIYIYKHGEPRKGWFTYHGRRYYGHESNSCVYPAGSVTRDAFRIKNGRLYYFKGDGTKQTKRSENIILNHNSTSVRYIKMPGPVPYRFNVRLRRYQYKTGGRWKDTGMQCWPYGQIDWQP